MARFLTGQELNDAVYDVVNTAKTELVLMCPFFKLDGIVKNLLSEKLHDKGLEIIIVFGKNEHDLTRSLPVSDFEFFSRFSNIRIIYQPDLHAKYYANERISVLTSLNLHDYSLKNNIEYGYAFDKYRGDNDSDIREYTKSIIAGGALIYPENPQGYCIRCGQPIDFNPEQPMCYKCFQVWADFRNADYPENFCHYSGEESFGQTSFRRPVMRKNWHKIK